MRSCALYWILYISLPLTNYVSKNYMTLDQILPLSTKLNQVEFDIYLKDIPKLSEQSLPHQWCFKINWNIAK